MKKYVQVDMASNKSTAFENYADIKKAVDSASVGLYSNYGVQILNISTIYEKIIMEVDIPNDIVEKFRIGNHFRGVSAYLMKNYNDKYSKLLVGKRLLTFTVIPSPDEKEDYVSFNDKLSAISKFIELQKCDDQASKSKIQKIIAILDEED